MQSLGGEREKEGQTPNDNLRTGAGETDEAPKGGLQSEGEETGREEGRLMGPFWGD